MTALQEIGEKLEEEASDHERSILLVEIMNALGFSKNEREINRHGMHLMNVLRNMFRSTDKDTTTIVGSMSEGMCGGIRGHRYHHDVDNLQKVRHIKLYTPPTNNINIPLNPNEDYDASFFVNEDDNFPGYVKLSLVEVSDYSPLIQFTIKNDGKLYFSNSMIMDYILKHQTKLPKMLGRLFDSSPIREIHGPAITTHHTENTDLTHTNDNVYCIHYDAWPKSANLFITRRKPNNWPSNSMLENIKSQGCDVVAVGHHDSKYNDIQWRISFPGERNLLFDLTDVQTLCYALIKIIVKENLNTSQGEVVSSFHVKNVIFWCVEVCSCQWAYSNYIDCVNICLAKLIEMIKGRHIPHYIIESRNLFNSKMTEKMSAEIVDVLSKYDTTRVFRLDAFDSVFEDTHYNKALLKNAALTSTIMACFNASFSTFAHYVFVSSSFLDSYIAHNGTHSFLNYVKILQNLKEVKGMANHYVKYVVKSMLGFLYYEQYRESNKADILLTSKRLIHQSLKLDNSCVKLRAAIFFLSNMEYSKSVEICDTFLTFPPRYKMDSYYDYFQDIMNKVVDQLVQEKTTEENEIVMTEILPMFYTSVKLKPLPENYDITQQNLVWIFRNLTNICFHGLYMDVTFMTAEKWVVPDPIQYELLSLPHNADHEEFPVSGIHLDPMFVCLQTKLLCYYSMGHVNGMDNMLTLMSGLLTDSTFTANISCVYLNMLVYCQIKAGHHRQSVKYLLQSLRIFPSKYNAASGYLKIVLQILNSLSI